MSKQMVYVNQTIGQKPVTKHGPGCKCFEKPTPAPAPAAAPQLHGVDLWIHTANDASLPESIRVYAKQELMRRGKLPHYMRPFIPGAELSNTVASPEILTKKGPSLIPSAFDSEEVSLLKQLVGRQQQQAQESAYALNEDEMAEIEHEQQLLVNAQQEAPPTPPLVLTKSEGKLKYNMATNKYELAEDE